MKHDTRASVLRILADGQPRTAHDIVESLRRERPDYRKSTLCSTLNRLLLSGAVDGYERRPQNAYPHNGRRAVMHYSLSLHKLTDCP